MEPRGLPSNAETPSVAAHQQRMRPKDWFKKIRAEKRERREKQREGDYRRLHSATADPKTSLSRKTEAATPAGNDQCPAGVELYQLGDEVSRDVLAEEDPGYRPPPLNGTPWCKGSMPNRYLENRAALVLIGQPFRAKNFVNHSHMTCAQGTYASQKLVVESHKENIIAPLEDLGFDVDVFLSDAPCELEVSRRQYQDTLDGAANLIELKAQYTSAEDYYVLTQPLQVLKMMYGRERVKGSFRPNTTNHMYEKFGEMFESVDKAMQKMGGLYEYVVVIRYDVMVDRPFTTQMPNPPSTVHHGMTFWQKAHDFMWSFPGDLWTCMLKFWQSCMTVVGPHGVGTIGMAKRRELGCFEFGPVQLVEWHAGAGFHIPLDAISRKFMGSKLLQPRDEYHRMGTSAWDVNGKEHRCKNDGYNPPKHSVEDRFMPLCFHVE